MTLYVGEPAPDFCLANAAGSTTCLKDFRGQQAILYFYPAADTPGCTTQACDFRDNLSALNHAGYAVVGISPDSPAKLAAFAQKYDLSFPLLSDPEKTVLQAYEAYGEKISYGKTITGVIRSTVVVDAEGLIVLAAHNVKAKGHVAGLLNKLALD